LHCQPPWFGPALDRIGRPTTSATDRMPILLATKRSKLAALAALGITLAGAAAAQELVPEGGREKRLRVVRTDKPPVIDGVLDEREWAAATRVDDMHEIQPTEYAPARERTVVYVMYDSNALYIGARLYQDPKTITARILRQGERVFGDDWFSVMIDPFHDKRSGYRFQTNPNGLRQEALYQNVSDEQWNWEGIWETAAAIDDQGWTTEIAIPFKTLSFDPSNDTWGINFRRSIAVTDERVGWVSRNRNTDPSTSGSAVGFEGLDQGLGLDVVPSVSVRQRHYFNPADRRTDTEPSIDLFYKITPSLTGSLTINTDFSATDVDDRQVNLTRFDLFFPEKREFFLQDADIFEFGGLNENGRPFFSRSIGITESGDLLDLDVGGKLTGRVGRWNIGALSVRQGQIDGVPADNASVARVSANLLAESSVGIIMTEGDPGTSVHNSVAGADFLYRNSRLPGNRLLEVNAWTQRSDTEGLTGDQKAYGWRVSMPNNTGWRGGVRFSRLGADFNPGLGFVNRRDIKQWNFGAQYTRRPREGKARSMLAGFNGERVEWLDGQLQSQQIRYRLMELENRLGDKLAVQYVNEQEVLRDPFAIFRDVTIPAGSYRFSNWRVSMETADQRKLWVVARYQTGEFYDGDRTEISGEVNWRPAGRFRTSVGYTLNDIDLPAGDFATRLVQVRADVAFSSKLSWVTRIQYDNVSELMGINMRLHWTPEAGRDAYLVINHTLDDVDLDNRLRSALSEAAIKINYTFRF
jgi:Domain of unknown function (DUF5916)/Carbohydrate family 9 binding domain-like